MGLEISNFSSCSNIMQNDDLFSSDFVGMLAPVVFILLSMSLKLKVLWEKFTIIMS